MRNWLIVLLLLGAGPELVSAEVAKTYVTGGQTVTGVASNVAIDAVAHGLDSVGIWLVTGHGLNYSYDSGGSWFVINTTNGLPGENLSAAYSNGGRIWTATNHEELVGSMLYSMSNGLSYSDDDGASWYTLDFGPADLNIPRVEGGDRTIFDITGHIDQGYWTNRMSDQDVEWVFFAAFAGGLLASQDGGDNWRRIFPDLLHDLQFNEPNEAPMLSNRYFSCAADSSHGDSLFLWAGTAGGVFQFVFVPPAEKLFSASINDVVFCDSCLQDGGSGFLMGGDAGLSIGVLADGTVTSRFVSNGLPAANVIAVTAVGDYMLAATDSAGLFKGLVRSGDGGQTFTAPTGGPPVGSSDLVPKFMLMDDTLLFMAAGTAGLFLSVDLGQSFNPVPFDTLYAEAEWQAANAVEYLGDTLWVGTDSGLVHLTLDANRDITNASRLPFVDEDSSAARIVGMNMQTITDSLGVVDSTILWTIHRVLDDAVGVPMVGRRGWVIDTLAMDTTYDTTIVLPDTTIDTTYLLIDADTMPVWSHLQVGVITHDVDFFNDTAFAVGEGGIRFSPDESNPSHVYYPIQYDDTLAVDNILYDTVTSMEVRQDTVIFGTSSAVAISYDRGLTYNIYRTSTDSLAADLVIWHRYETSDSGLAGEWIPALDVQYQATGPAKVWASVRPTSFGRQGLSVGKFNESGDLIWSVANDELFAWNFEFDSNTVFAATDAGLLRSSDADNTTWDLIPMVDEISGEVLVADGTPAYGVGVVDSFLWVGTNDGTVRLRLSDLGDQELYSRVDSTTPADEVYAYPVPFSPLRGQEVDFHFVVEKSGSVTLEIYDFAMNLVARPIDNVHHEAGIYPAANHRSRPWDGFNGQGDQVAAGVYYFKVMFASGDERWGKLAVIP